MELTRRDACIATLAGLPALPTFLAQPTSEPLPSLEILKYRVKVGQLLCQHFRTAKISVVTEEKTIAVMLDAEGDDLLEIKRRFMKNNGAIDGPKVVHELGVT